MSTHKEIMDDFYGEIITRSKIVGEPFQMLADEGRSEPVAKARVLSVDKGNGMNKGQAELCLEHARKAKWTASLICESYIALVEAGQKKEADTWLRSRLVQNELADGQQAIGLAEQVDRAFKKRGIFLERVHSISSSDCLPGSYGSGKRK
jgi:hypothetical protein